MGWFDLGVPTIGGNAHAAGRLVLDDGAPMGPSFRSGHLLPPNDEDFSFSESIAQRRTAEKTGWSDAYARPEGMSGRHEEDEYLSKVKATIRWDKGP